MLLFARPLAATAQDVFQSGAQNTPPPEQFNGGAVPAEDLHKYLSPDGRFIDHCRYWHDHPDPDTLMYGWPDHFAPGQPLGETRSFNGQPAPYGRCAIDPCPPNGYICWRNPAKPQPPNVQLQAVLKAQGCQATPTGEIFCARDKLPHPGPPSATAQGGLVKSKCHVTGTGGISCDPNEQFAGGDTPSAPGDQFSAAGKPPATNDQFAGGDKQPGPGDQFDGGTPGTRQFGGDPSHRTPQPPPCVLPELQQLAQTPDDGATAVAFGAEIGGDVAQAQWLITDGDVAVAVAMPATPGPGTFTAPPKPVILRGKASIGAWRTPPDHPLTLKGYATKSLRVPVTYRPAHPKPSSVTPQERTQIQKVLSGGARYDDATARYRFLSGFLQCMAARLQEKTRFGFPPAGEEPESGKSCKLTAGKKQEPPLPVFEDAVVEPEEHRVEAAKFYADMFDEVLKHNEELAKKFPGLEKSLGMLGPLLSGASYITSFVKTREDIMKRDTALQKALATAKATGKPIDPVDIGCLVGRDAADAYAYFINTSFGLALQYDPGASKK